MRKGCTNRAVYTTDYCAGDIVAFGPVGAAFGVVKATLCL